MSQEGELNNLSAKIDHAGAICKSLLISLGEMEGDDIYGVVAGVADLLDTLAEQASSMASMVGKKAASLKAVEQ